MAPTGVDAVLTAPPPTFTDEEAAAIARDAFGVVGSPRSVGSERDQTFLVDGDRPAVMKISNAAERTDRLDMEALAAWRARLVDPALPVVVPHRVPGSVGDDEDPACYRAALERDGRTHQVRMYDRLPGRASVLGATLSDDAIRGWGTMAARLGRALRGFIHPAAPRVMLWDPQHALLLREGLPAVADPAQRSLVSRVLDRYEQVVTPIWPSLRAHVLHGDLCTDNVLVDEAGVVTGIIDFGDMGFTALVVDAAVAIESLVEGRDRDDVLRAARIVLDGYERVTPLEPEELAIIGELVAARACASVVVPASRQPLYGDGEWVMSGLRRNAVRLLETLDATGFDEVRRRLSGSRPAPAPMPALVGRRARAFGPALAPLSYDEPLHVVAADGVWLTDADGRRYLDAYNNVPVVGHAHPRVTEAIARQARRLNTNLRYLHETAVELAERLAATTEPGLDVVMFVNSGSEANDLAWRIATTVTGGRGALCTRHAYHGITDASFAVSPEAWGDRPRPDHVRTWTPPDLYRGVDQAAESFREALDALGEAGFAPAASILDGVLTSEGVLDLPAPLVQALVRLTREAGGLWIADEVQGGHARAGERLWSYQRYGIEPDLITLGKPMGNGHPVAAVITRADIAERFAAAGEFFSTFGGNPVAAAAALAVLDVIDDERLVANARTTGDHVRAGLRGLQPRWPALGDVRGTGLVTGVEIVADPATREPDAATARAVANGLRRRGVLIGTTGRADNVLKIRPPLVFRPEHADTLVAALEETLADGSR